MYIDTSHLTRGGKTYPRHLLRESYRANGKVLHRTLANVSHCSTAEIEAMRLALRHKEDLEYLGAIQDAMRAGRCWGLGRQWHLLHLKIPGRIPPLKNGAALPVQRPHARL